MTEETKEMLYENLEINTLENSEVEIKGEIPLPVIEKMRPVAIKKLGQNKEIAGFRKGNAPENVLVQHLGEPAILYEVAEEVLATAYPQIILENKIDAIGRPQITITKLAPGNPIGFAAKTATMPVVTLPDYKKIAEKVKKDTPGEEIVVTDEEIEQVITQLKENKQTIEKQKSELDLETASGEKITKADDEKEPLPELTDEDVKKLGDFKDLEDFKTKIKENMKKDKEQKQVASLREKIVEGIVEKTDISMPALFVEAEIDRMMHDFTYQLSSMGLSLEDYMKKVEKDEQTLRAESRPEGEKRAKTQLILSKIAGAEKLEIEEEKMEKEIAHILETHPDAHEESVRNYLSTILLNEQVLAFLEK